MKKLIIIPLLFILLSVQGQTGRYPFYRGVTAAGEGGGGEAPSFLTSDGYTEGWYIADAANFTLDETAISQWDDLSGNDNHLLNATGTDRPTWDSGNGEVDFDGTDDYLSDASFVYDQPILIYAVIRFNSYTAEDNIFRIANYGGGRLEQSASGATILTLIGGGETLNTGSSFYSTGTYYILRVLWNNGEVNGSFMQINENTAATGTLATDGSDFFNIGRDSNPPDISVKEVIVRSAADSGTDQGSVVDYLNAKYSVY